MSIIRKSAHILIEQYRLVFEWKTEPGAGFSFPCNKAGEVLLDEVPETARENLESCLNGDYDVVAKGVHDCSHYYYERAVVRCECRKEVVLWHHYTNECVCGRLYNGFGQGLAPRSQWGNY